MVMHLSPRMAHGLLMSSLRLQACNILAAKAPMLRATIFTLASTVVAAGIGACLDLAALGACLVVAALISGAAWLRITQQVVGFQWRAISRMGARSALVALTTAVAPAIALLWFGSVPVHVVPPLALGVAGGGAGFLFAVMVLRHPLRDEVRRLGATLKMREARGGSS